ncbi:MAG: response regulator [Caldilineaceae bacterium]
MAVDYDVLVLDIMLPEMDGMALLRELRQQGKHTPTLMLTARHGGRPRGGLGRQRGRLLGETVRLFGTAGACARLLRRPPLQTGTVLQIADLEMDTAKREVRRNRTFIKLSRVNMRSWNI